MSESESSLNTLTIRDCAEPERGARVAGGVCPDPCPKNKYFEAFMSDDVQMSLIT